MITIKTPELVNETVNVIITKIYNFIGIRMIMLLIGVIIVSISNIVLIFYIIFIIMIIIISLIL